MEWGSKMKKTCLFISIFFSISLWAGFEPNLTIKGELVEKDSCDMKIKQKSGETFLLPLKEFSEYLGEGGRFVAKIHINKLRLALRGTDLGGGSNSRGTDIGGGSNTRNCHLRKNLSLRERKMKAKGTSIFAFTEQAQRAMTE